VEVIGSGKHSSLLQYGNNYCRKKFYSTGRHQIEKKYVDSKFYSIFLRTSGNTARKLL
jgi:hypothetical protein